MTPRDTFEAQKKTSMLSIHYQDANTFTSGLRSLRYRPTPDIVPPVPMPATKMSTLPFVSSQISGPVVS